MGTSELGCAAAFLRERFPDGGRVLCAVSGGLDSMCLLYFLDAWGRERGIFTAAAHFNHRLRETADRDASFVRDWCRERDIPFFAGAGDVGALAAGEGLSVEEAGRKLRYGFLQETAERAGCDAILTAHHADDSAETMLLNLVRGAGVSGLTGIPRERGNVLRPFLGLTRAELAAYAAAHGIPHVEDETNANPDAAARNLVRLRVMPLLRRINPRAVEHIAHTAAVLGRENEVVRDLAAELARRAVGTREGLSVSRKALLEAPRAVAERAVLELLAEAAGGRKDLTAAHVEAVLDLAERGSGDAALPRGLSAWTEGGALRIGRRAALSRVELIMGEAVLWGGYTVTLLDRREGEGLALRPGTEPVFVGVCDPAARLCLPGTNGGGRTVKRLCLDRRVSLAERDSLPAAYVGERLAAVWRLGTDMRFRPEGESCRFVQIRKTREEREHGQ